MQSVWSSSIEHWLYSHTISKLCAINVESTVRHSYLNCKSELRAFGLKLVNQFISRFKQKSQKEGRVTDLQLGTRKKESKKAELCLHEKILSRKDRWLSSPLVRVHKPHSSRGLNFMNSAKSKSKPERMLVSEFVSKGRMVPILWDPITGVPQLLRIQSDE